jgi:trans-2,3-dihydro-3-hydroxyanthranilate isomerase
LVLDAEHLSTTVMQELTREVRQFETAFLTGVDLPGRAARLRIFTEDEELDFAGHPVLGAAAVLHSLLPASDAEQSWALAVAQRTVEVRTRGADRWVDAAMDQGVPKFGPAIAGDLAQAYRDALNLAHGQLHPALPMQVVSTGLPYLIVPVQSGLDSARSVTRASKGFLTRAGRSSSMYWTRTGRRARAGPSGPVHRAAQHDRGSPGPGRPAVGWRTGGTRRGRALPRPSDLTAAAPAQ